MHIEDSLYAATYQAFKDDRYDEVISNASISETRFPQGANRPRVIFIHGMSLLNGGDASGCVELMRQVVDKYPQSEVSPIAGMIIKGVEEGRRLHGGKFDLGDLWTRRSVIAAAADSTKADTLSAERQSPHVFMLLFNPSKVSPNSVLVAVRKYNFTSFMVRSFDMHIEEQEGVCRLIVSGFLNYDEAMQYARRLSSDKDMTERLKGCRHIVVSESNMALVGTRYSYEEYDKFFISTLAPVQISNAQLLNLPETVITEIPEDSAEGAGEDTDEEPDEEPASDDTFDFEEDFYR